MRAWNTQEDIAEGVGCEQKTVSNILSDFSKNGDFSEISKNTQNFKVKYYNVWNYSEKKLGWTQEEIARVVGLKRDSISKIVKKFDIELFHNEYKAGLKRRSGR